jgi:hypothetical protein
MIVNGENIVLTQRERTRILKSSPRCPNLKGVPLIPFADKFYFYCSIRQNRGNKTGIDKSYIGVYCCNDTQPLAYENCPIWKQS